MPVAWKWKADDGKGKEGRGRLRILHVVRKLNQGGIASSLWHTLPFLSNLSDTQVEVATSYTSGYFGELLARDGVPVRELHLARKYDPRSLLQLTALLRRGDHDVVHAHGWPELLFVALASLVVHGPRYVLSEHNVTNRRRCPLLKPLDRFIYSRYHRIIAVSQAVADALTAWLPRVTPKVTVVHNDVDPARLNATPNADQAVRTELGISDDAPIILSGGGLEYRKGVDILLYALAQLHPPIAGKVGGKAVAPNVQPVALIAGTGPDGDKLRCLANDLGLSQSIRFLGFRRDLPSIMAAADVFVLSSRWEGGPMVVLEAMVMGTPVVATTIGRVPELIEDGVHGLLVPPENPQPLAEALDWTLSHPVNARMMADRAQRRVKRECPAEVSARKLRSIYQAVMDEAGYFDRSATAAVF